MIDLSRSLFYYNLSLREIEHSLTNYSLIHNMTGGNLEACYQFVLVYLSILKVINPKIYQKLSHNSISYSDLVSTTNLEKLVDDNWLATHAIENHPLKYLLRYCLSTKEEFQHFMKENIGDLQVTNIFINQNRNIIKDICKWMNTFEIK